MSAAVRHWPAPLDRRVTLEGDSVTLREGLARLATAARVKLSYVAELLPLDRPLCLAYRAVPAGQVLADVLGGTDLEPVIVGDDQVVLAPARRTAVAVPDDAASMSRGTSVLDRIVVTGSAELEPERSLPVSVAVVRADRLAGQQTTSLTDILDGAVPGLWMWESAPASLTARYGSVRGASSFGISYPKIYIDGIEVANPLLLKQLDASTIERLEVIRGPQGAALYGADAISGVINIVTRHDAAGPGAQRLQVQSTAGVLGSEFASEGVLTQQHAVTFRAGTVERSGGIGLNVSSLGAYVPGAFARTIAVNANFRIVGTRTALTATTRIFSEDAGSPANPLLPQMLGLGTPGAMTTSGHHPSGGGPHGGFGATHMGAPPADPKGTQSVRQYTVGGSLAFVPNERWTHAFVLGVDGYRLRNPSLDNGPIPTPVDSALEAARGGSDRITARMSSTARYGTVEGAAASLTLTAEHSAAREQSTIVSTMFSRRVGSRREETPFEGRARLIGWRGNSGLLAQANTSLRNWLFLTAGMRLERNDAIVGTPRVTTLPMLGGAIVGDHGDLTLKVRAAYGKAIRPVQGVIRELTWGGRSALIAYDLEPEQQSGVEAGVDFLVGRTFGLHVTRFDQRASGLIQSVAITLRPETSPEWPADEMTRTAVAYQLQNVGRIANRGWEIEGSADLGRLALTSTLSLVDSRVQRLASGYSGDLQRGDRMLDVPARTASLTGAWNGDRWFTALTLSRASDWTGYDRLAVAEALTSGEVEARALVGARLRGFRREYDGVTRLRATYSRDLFRGLAFVMTGDNLLGEQRGEPDNVTVVAGRTITAGVKVKF